MAPTRDTSCDVIRRTVSDEDGDLKDAVSNVVNEAYVDWPNEAGFDNLPEHRGPIEITVHGTIPSWASGSLFRTGPGARKIDDTPQGTLLLSHWFDGLAHTHRFDIVPTISDSDSDSEASSCDGDDVSNPVTVKVFYSSRRQCDELVAYTRQNGLRDMITFAQKADPCIGLFGKLMSSWSVARPDRKTKRLENIGVTVQLGVPGLPSSASSPSGGGGGGHRPRRGIWLGTDAHILREIDAKTLEPIGFAQQRDLHPELDGPFSCAHAQRCPKTGDYFNVNVKGGPKATYRVFRVSAATGKTEVLSTFSRPELPTAYIHSFFLSEHFVIIRVPSSHIRAYGLGVLWEKNLLDAMEPFDESKKCKWFVVDRILGRGVVAEFETEAAFFFHTVNCFEEVSKTSTDPTGTDDGGEMQVHVSCDTIEYPTMDILHGLYYDVMTNREGKAQSFYANEKRAAGVMPRLVRWKFTVSLPTTLRLPGGPSLWTWPPFSWLSSQSPRQPECPIPEQVFAIPSPHVGELPTINPAYHTRKYRYSYSLAMSGRSTFSDSIVKTDIVSREVLQWNNPHGHTPGESIFVARPGSKEEDDGVLLSVVLDGTCKESYLLCLDARTMRELGRAEMKFAVAIGFHGVHTPTAGGIYLN